MQSYAIEFDKVTKIYPTLGKPKNKFLMPLYYIYPYFGKVKALKEISFKVKKGKTMGIIGPNGAGKTTICKLVSCIIFPESGDVFVFGKNSKENPNEIKGKMAIQSEDFPLYAQLTVLENIEFSAKLHGKSLDREFLKLVLEKLDLEVDKHRLVEGFSTGMKVKANIARALALKPELLILDEPLANLDVFAREKVKELVNMLKKEGKTILLTSHHLNEIEDLCDEILLIDRGKCLGTFKTDEFIRKVSKKIGFVRIYLRSRERIESRYLERKTRDLYVLKVPSSKIKEELKNLVKYNFTDIYVERLGLEEVVKWYLKK